MVRRREEAGVVPVRVWVVVHELWLLEPEGRLRQGHYRDVYGEKYWQASRPGDRAGVCCTSYRGGRATEAAGGLEQGTTQSRRKQRSESFHSSSVSVDL